MVTHDGEGVDGAPAALCALAESVQKFLPVDVVNEEVALIDTPQHDVVEGSGCIQAGMTWHKATLL